MNVNIIFLKSRNGFSASQEKHIQEIVQDSAQDAGRMLGIQGPINFMIGSFYKRGVKKPWVEGYTITAELIWLSVPPRCKSNELQGIVYHEMHHIARGYLFFPSREEKFSLLNVIIAEGLALAFQIEQVPSRIPWWAKYKIPAVKRLFSRFQKEIWHDTSFEDWNWFYQKWWMRYQIGKYLVDEILRKHPKIEQIKLARKSAKELLKLSGLHP